jgi:hypothetical protein
MFQELQTLIEMQDEKLLQLEQRTEQTAATTAAAVKKIETAADIARSSRKVSNRLNRKCVRLTCYNRNVGSYSSSF